MKHLLFATAMACAALACQAQDSGLIAKGATLKKLSDGFAFTEGPASDKRGNVFFTDQPTDRILKWSVDGRLSTFMQPCGRANGLCFDKKGILWAAADARNELWKIDKHGRTAVVLTGYQNKLLNGPNDMWISPAGLLYFTDPFYKRSYWNRADRELPECVYSVRLDGRRLTRVVDDLKQPNGIIGTPDGKLLYIADIGAGKTYRYSIQKDGTLTDRKLHCSMGSDGMTIDNKGNIYLTNKGVFVFSPTGEQIEHIQVPEPWTANVCFGGKGRKTLFITASKGLYSMEMNVRGVNSQ